MGAISKFINKQPSFIKKTIYNIVPKFYRYGKSFRENLSYLLKTEWMSEDELRQIQLEKLKILINYSYEKIPYYRELFNLLKLKPNDFKEIEDLKKLPYLTKKEIIENKDKLISEDFHKLPPNLKVDHKSSGSSGTPLFFVSDKSVFEIEAAFIERTYRNNESSLYLNRSTWLRRYVPEDGQPFYKYDDDLQRVYLSPYHLSEITLDDYINLINNHGSKILVAYPSSAYALACLLKKTSRKLKHINFVHTASEKLIPNWINIIEETIAPVRDHYGMSERSCFFHKCLVGVGYHENLEYGVTEIEDDGQVVSTGFQNMMMPFIRYKPRDRVIKNVGEKICSCGRGNPLTISDIMGREDDILLTRDGRMLPPTNFYVLMDKIHGIRMFQIVQNSFDDIELFIVPQDQHDKNEIIEGLNYGMTQRCGSIKNLEIKFVDEIERSKITGKIRCIKSNIKR